MPTIEHEFSTLPPVLAYAASLRKNDELIAAGKGDSEEAELLADAMDGPWYLMTDREQERMRGLSGDLYALREGGPKRVEMTKEELAKWQEAARTAFAGLETGDVDAALVFLRQPIPSGLPTHVVPFLQGRCWERLGDLETALVFMKEAERLESSHAIAVVALLQRLEQTQELQLYADRVIDNAKCTPLEVYVAAVALLFPTHSNRSVPATGVLQRVAEAVSRAQKAYLALPAEQRELPNIDAEMAKVIGLCYERQDKANAALKVYNEAIGRHPNDGELFMFRGFARIPNDNLAALQDFRRAAVLAVPSIWPYTILARDALQKGVFRDALRFAKMASEQPGPEQARAEVYETIGIAQAELGQDQSWVLENFNRALALDPNNERIKQNRSIAATLAPSASRKGRRFPNVPLESTRFQNARGKEITNRLQRLSEARSNDLSAEALTLS